MTIEEVKALSDEELRVKVAELDGEDVKICPVHQSRYCCGRSFPNYPHDLNAVHEVEARFMVGANSYWSNLLVITDARHGRTMDWRAFAHASARERCEALLMTLSAGDAQHEATSGGVAEAGKAAPPPREKRARLSRPGT
jgi:hypothetical protein